MDCPDVGICIEDYSPHIESSVIGEFNGRTYTFAIVDGVPVIFIEGKGKDELLGGDYGEWQKGNTGREEPEDRSGTEGKGKDVYIECGNQTAECGT